MHANCIHHWWSLDDKSSPERGQVLVIILLVAVVGLTVGLSIAGRSLQTVEQTAQTEEANRAFSAAEAGVEEALLDLSTGNSVNIENPELEGGGKISNVTVNEIFATAADPLKVDLKKDEVTQFVLQDASGKNGDGDVVIQWTDPASLVIARVYQRADGGYGLQKYAYNSSSDYAGNNFELWDSTLGGKKISVDEGGEGVLLRIRAMYADTKLTIWWEEDNGNLPSQSRVIESTGQAGESQRTVKVIRMRPALPAIFDYVLFSGGSISK